MPLRALPGQPIVWHCCLCQHSPSILRSCHLPQQRERLQKEQPAVLAKLLQVREEGTPGGSLSSSLCPWHVLKQALFIVRG